MDNFEWVTTIIALFLSILAIIQTEKQIKQSKVEQLFEKRMKVFFSCEKLIDFYESVEHLIKNEKITVSELEKLYLFIQNILDINQKEDLTPFYDICKEIPFLWKGTIAYYYQNFLYLILFFIQNIIIIHLFFEKIDTEIQKENFFLKDYFLRHTIQLNWLENQKDLIRSYTMIKEKKIIQKIKKQIKF